MTWASSRRCAVPVHAVVSRSRDVPSCTHSLSNRSFRYAAQINKIVGNVRPDRQVALFSATFPPHVEALAKKALRHSPLEVIVGGRSVASPDIAQWVEVWDESAKFLRLLQLLGEWYDVGSTIVFVDTKDHADTLFLELTKAGYPSLSLHGGKDQLDRDGTIAEFKSGAKRVLVATSVAGRGLDVPAVVLVVNYR